MAGLAVASLAGLASASAVRAQQTVIVTGTVVSAVTGEALPYSTVGIGGGAQRFSGADGRFSFDLAPGEYSLRVRQLGFSPLDTVIRVGRGADIRGLVFRLQPIAFRLDAVRTYAKSCRTSAQAADLAVLLEELTKNADRERLLRTEYPFVYQLERQIGYRGIGGFTNRAADTLKYYSKVLPRYAPGNLVQRVDSTDPKSESEMRVPTLVDLADPSFINTHCYRFRGVTNADDARVYKIDFEPTSEISTTDVEGSAYIDTATYLIKKAVFRLTRPDKLKPPVLGLEVTTTYREIFKGLGLFDEIHSEQPLNKRGRLVVYQVQDQKLAGILFYGRTPESVVIPDVQLPPKPKIDSTARLAGVVVDSAGRRLSRAEILVADGGARTTSTDSGQFLLVGLKPAKTSFVVRTLGFAPATFTQDLRPGRTRRVRVVLTRVTVQLSTIVVEESASEPMLANAGYYDRKKGGFGTFITPEQIEARNATLTSDLLRGVRGVDIQQVTPFSTVPYSRRTPGCVMNVFIDGIAVKVDKDNGLENVLPGSEVGAIEIYAGPSETPPKFLGASNGCGSIVIWTKSFTEREAASDSTKRE